MSEKKNAESVRDGDARVESSARRGEKMSEKKKREIAGLVIALVVVLVGGVLFVGAVAGWFDDGKAVLSAEYRCAPAAESAENADEIADGSENASDSEKAENLESSESSESSENSGDDETLEICTGEFPDLTVEEYENLIAEKKSFLIVVDQPSCTTAEKLKGYAKEYALENGVRIYRMVFSDLKNSTLHEKIKYYPSFAVISEGEVLNFLRADSDEDAPAYNSYEDFAAWLNNYLEL